MDKIDFYHMSKEEFAKYYNAKVQRFNKKLLHLKHEFNLTNDDFSHSFAFTFYKMIIETDPAAWYIHNYDVGGMLDDYDDRRTSNYKNLKSFCEKNL